MTGTRTALVALVFGLLGFVLAFGGWHLYRDHQAHHAMLNFLNEQAAPNVPHGPTP